MTNNIFLLGMPNASELMVTLLIVFVLFGGKKIPELAKGLGKGIRDFNEAKDGLKNEIANSSVPAPETPATETAQSPQLK